MPCEVAAHLRTLLGLPREVEKKGKEEEGMKEVLEWPRLLS